jgi:hypothetical protein
MDVEEQNDTIQLSSGVAEPRRRIRTGMHDLGDKGFDLRDQWELSGPDLSDSGRERERLSDAVTIPERNPNRDPDGNTYRLTNGNTNGNADRNPYRDTDGNSNSDSDS